MLGEVAGVPAFIFLLMALIACFLASSTYYDSNRHRLEMLITRLVIVMSLALFAMAYGRG